MQDKKEDEKEETKIRKDIPCRVYEVKNQVENSKFKFKAIVFHCATREERDTVTNSDFKLIGSKLIS